MFVVLFMSLILLCTACFEDKNAEFQHLVVDRNSGHVFIGAVNKIYELSEDLAIEKWIPTGPLNKTDDKLTDNVNKVLILDDSGRLITCGSALGICSIRNITNIYIGCDVPITVVSDEEKVSTVAFLAAGPLSSNRSTRILYLASEVKDNKDIPSITGRLLDNRNDFEIAKVLSEHNEINQVKGADIHNNFLYAKDNNVNYVYGFSSGIYSYFLKTQKKEDGDYHSVIARVCQDDENYYNSYTEIPITCKNTDNTSYNLAQTGFVQKAAGFLAQSLEISSNDDVLYAAFCPDNEKSSSPLEKSVLCVFSLQNIRKKFAENIKKCFNGNGMRSIGLKKPESCLKTDLQTDYEDVCGLGVNVPLDGRIPLEGNALIYFADKVSALIATNVRDHSVIIAGTASGRLKKVIADNATLGVEYQDIIVHESHPIMKDLIFSHNDEYLYALTKVFKIPIQECSDYKSYTECFQDIYCGWCSPKQKCTIESDCKYAHYKDPLFWISSGSKFQAVITEVKPNNIFITSETLLTVKIENVVNLIDQMFCNFVLDGVSYVTNGTQIEKGTQCKTPIFNSNKTYGRGLDPIPIKLLIQNSITEPAFAATIVNFLDCNTFTSCTECIKKTDCK
ncbi:plexin A3-like [Bombyx mori]|uniref:plexin A3-like n=1 Tax=Bombyx mori TaxID=7091 RepID=UPI002ED4E9AC